MHEIEPVKAPVSRVVGDVVQAAVPAPAPMPVPTAAASPKRMSEDGPASLDEVWRSFRNSVRAKVLPEQFESWFRRAALVSVDADVLRLAVQNNFAREWLVNYYLEKLEAAAREVLKGARRIEITVDPELCLPAGADRAAGEDTACAALGGSCATSGAPSDASLGMTPGASLDAAMGAFGSPPRGSLGGALDASQSSGPTSREAALADLGADGAASARGDRAQELARDAARSTASMRTASSGREATAPRRASQRSHDARRDDARGSAGSAHGGASSTNAPSGDGAAHGLLWKSDIGLNPKYTFDNFVVGPCNRFAHAAAVGAAEAPGRNYNPFFLHGSVGLGKTHLLQSLCFALLDRNPQTRIQYLSCETFVNHFISALENGNVQKFRNKYRNVDVLVVDDIHVLANKDRTQEEFFHTFNTLYQSGKQIVLSSDSPPKDIPTLQERLVSRFKWGLVTEIEPPCFETRMAILKRKSRERGRELPDDVACLLAERIDSNIRELEGAVTKLLGFAGVTCSQVSCDLAREALRDVFEARKGQPSMEDILTVVCEHFDVKISELQSKKRTNAIAYPRQIAMYLARQITRHSLEEIGGYFGGRDHSTVIYAIEKVGQLVLEDGEARGVVDGFLARLQGPGG